MKNFIVLFFILCSFYNYSQERHKDGLYREFRENGGLIREGFYKNNKKVGVWKNYHKNGKIYKVYSYSDDGKLTGLEKQYSEVGVLTRETNLNEQGDLVRKLYSDSSNVFAKYIVVRSTSGDWFMKQGAYKEYYENSSLKVTCKYVNDEINGVWRSYYITGEKEWEVEYTNGYRQGSYKQFFKNGAVKVEGVNFEDYKNGNEKQFNENGNLIWEGKYADGQLTGLWRQYNAEGVVINKLKYNNGKLKKSDNSITLTEIEVPDGLIERVPVYPGCDLPGNYNKKNCMANEITRFVMQKFNTTFAPDLGLTGKQHIYVIFKIDETGNVIDIRARAQHRALEAEAIRVIALLPKMTPGYIRGKAVKVPYSLPIVFNLKNSK